MLAGGSGFLGRALAGHFCDAGFDVVILTRTPHEKSGRIRERIWDGREPGEWTQELEQAVAIINLTGRSVDCRYTEQNRKEILESRVRSTRVVGEAIANSKHPPRVWLNASTATIYQHTFGPAWDESGTIADTPEANDVFSVEVARAWENELEIARTPSTRKVALRTAMVLGRGKNSVFPVLKRLTRLGLGGEMGTGQQFVSWIHETDFCRAIEWLVVREEFCDAVNVCTPHPIPNSEMMRVLRSICGAPFGLPAARWMLEVGAFFLRTEPELILKSRRVIPRRLVESGFEFQFPKFSEAIRNLNS
ncbi:MAG: TIGR01777 family oxidoreductase [Verrucomicrobiota bacterium]